MGRIKSEDKALYTVRHDDGGLTADDRQIVRALAILNGRLKAQPQGDGLTSPNDVKDFLRLRLAEKEHEIFGVLFLDSRHRLIDAVDMFRGTIDGASVHVREVCKEALQRNAAAVIFYHNHPSGVTEPSSADVAITKRLVDALRLLDVRALDHIIVGRMDTLSFAERGMI